MAVLATGKDAAIGILGSDRIRESQAFHQFPNQDRAYARSSWEPYCFNVEGAWIITSLDARAVRKSTFQAQFAVDVAVSYKERLERGDKPWRPPNPITHVGQWEPSGNTLAVDFEGWETIERVAVANDKCSLSCQWSPQVRHWLRERLDEAERILAHNMGFELNLLENDGVEVDESKWHCTMTAHQTLNPWRDVGLGKSAPLYVMTEPWKHKFESDEEDYSTRDAAILIPMDIRQQELMKERAAFSAYELDRALHLATRRLKGRVQSTFRGVMSPLTRAANTVELKGTDATGYDVGVVDFWQVIERLIGETINQIPDQCHIEIAKRHALGYGLRQLRGGLGGRFHKQLRPLNDAILDDKEHVTEFRLELWDQANPAFVNWRELVRKQASRDGYVQTFNGRRLYGFREGEAQRGIIMAAIADEVRQKVVEFGAIPGEVNGEYLRGSGKEPPTLF